MKKAIGTILLLGALSAAPEGGAQEAGGLGVGAPTMGKPTAEALSAFLDQAVPALMEEHHNVGAVVGVADSSEILVLRGYGSADLERGTPVDPQETLFMAGSITKLLTWTAVMQLEEQGKLRLDDPVQDYLDFDIPDTFDEPIRIIDLMNHTPGFEDRLVGLMVQQEKHRRTLKQSVSRDVPRRVRPPGQEVCYSNYGTMLAGYVVERVSGMPYEEYVERHILRPLRMDNSTLRQPAPPGLAARLATPYAYDGKRHVPQKLEILNGAPAGALITTAPDMLRFYQAYLNGGELEGRRILKEQTVLRMRGPSFRHDPRAGGLAHGFFEVIRGDLRGFGHGGDTIYFHSDSGYLPEQDLAYFVSTNSATGSQLTFKLQGLLFDRFFPVPTGEELAAQADLETDLQEYTGFFSMNRRSESDPTQVIGGFTLIKPKLSEDGQGLWIASILEPEGTVYVPVARDIFQQREGSMRIVFLRDERGRVQSLYSNELPAFLFSRPPWIEHPALSITVLVLGAALLLSGLIAPPTGLLTLIPRLRWKAGSKAGSKASSKPGLKDGHTSRLLALWSGRGYLLLVLLQVAVVASLGNLIFVPIGPAHGVPLYLAAAAALVTLAGVVLSWREKLFRRLGRLHYTAFAGSQALLVAWLGYWGFFFV